MSSRLLLPPLYHDDITATAAASSTAAPTRQRRCTDNASDATLRPYDADNNVPHAIVIMRIGRRALELIIRNGPAGFRPGPASDREQRRRRSAAILSDTSSTTCTLSEPAALTLTTLLSEANLPSSKISLACAYLFTPIRLGTIMRTTYWLLQHPSTFGFQNHTRLP